MKNLLLLIAVSTLLISCTNVPIVEERPVVVERPSNYPPVMIEREPVIVESSPVIVEERHPAVIIERGRRGRFRY